MLDPSYGIRYSFYQVLAQIELLDFGHSDWPILPQRVLYCCFT